MNEENVILHLNCVTWSGGFSYFRAQRCRNPSRKLKRSIDRQIKRCLSLWAACTIVTHEVHEGKISII